MVALWQPCSCGGSRCARRLHYAHSRRLTWKPLGFPFFLGCSSSPSSSSLQLACLLRLRLTALRGRDRDSPSAAARAMAQLRRLNNVVHAVHACAAGGA